MQRAGRMVTVLLLAAALLGFAARAASHEHPAAAAGDGLCAICVYGGTTLGGAPAPHAQPCLHFQAPRPVAAVRDALPATPALPARIRGPPVPA